MFDTATQEGTTYTWDVRNRLVGIASSQVSAAFTYDALNRRTGKTINGVAIQYVYDGLNVIKEIRNPGQSTDFIHSLNIDEPLYLEKADGTLRYYLADALGSVVALVDGGTGNVTTSYAYDPFGQVTITGSDENPFQYTGRENDGTGLYYYRARYYSPTLRRFISEDPIGLAGGLNFYAYVQNNPVNFVDPLGLERSPNWNQVLKGGVATTGGVVALALAPETMGASTAILLALGSGGSVGWGVAQIGVGLTGNELPFSNTTDALITATTRPGLLRDGLIASHEIFDLSRGASPKTAIEKALSMMESGISINDSINTVMKCH